MLPLEQIKFSAPKTNFFWDLMLVGLDPCLCFYLLSKQLNEGRRVWRRDRVLAQTDLQEGEAQGPEVACDGILRTLKVQWSCEKHEHGKNCEQPRLH